MKAEGGRRKEVALWPRCLSSHALSRFILHPSSSILCLVLAGCSTVSPTRAPPPPVARAPGNAPATAAAGSPTTTKPATPRGGGYYLDDGPGDNPPANLDQVPDAIPKREVLARGAMRPYNVMGQNYTPMTALQPYRVRGIASWYGRRYHGKQTSSGEIYDMYEMTAAHTILPIPSYARITNLATNKSIVVRINDRGPFHSDRLIDLSYTAAYKLGVLGGGRAMVEVETIIPDAGTTVSTRVAATAPPVSISPGPATGTLVAPPPAIAVPLPLQVDPETAIGADPLATIVAAPDPAPRQAVLPLVSELKGVFLQLGAFGSQDNANGYLTRLRSEVEWLAPALHVYVKDGLFRVHAGPYANQGDARAAADHLSQSLGIKAVVLTR